MYRASRLDAVCLQMSHYACRISVLIDRFTSCYHELAITEIKLMSYGSGCLGVFSNKIALIVHDFSAAITFSPAPVSLSFEFRSAFRKALTHKHLSS